MHRPLIEIDYGGLRKVISGGQCGADQGGLVAAIDLGLETGGWAPKGWRTAQGPRPDLEKLGLREHSSSDSHLRTLSNVLSSDATIAFASRPNSTGTLLTKKLCVRHNKPFHLVKLPVPSLDLEQTIRQATDFIVNSACSTLNVAGNRDLSSEADYHKWYTHSLLSEIFKDLRDSNLLVGRTP